MRRRKAESLRYRKAIVKDINIEKIQEVLWDIQEECEEVRWYFDGEDDTLLNALDGDEDQAFEFRMMFAELCAECEKMREDFRDAYIPECFNDIFVAAGGGDIGGGLLGWDEYEQDYIGLSCPGGWAEKESSARLMRLTKKQIIECTQSCMGILCSYLGLRHRYDCLKAALDILRDQNTGYLQMVKRIEEAYKEAEKVEFEEYTKEVMDFDRVINNLPNEAWLQ